MEIFIAEQCKTLAESCILGLIFGVGYDIIRILHVLWGIQSYSGDRSVSFGGRGAFLLFFAGDFVYMMAVLFWSSVFLYHANHGQFRLFLAAGCIAGFCLYHYTAGRLVMRISETIVRFCKKLAYHLIIRPCRLLTGFFLRFVCFLWHIGPEKLIKLFRNTVCRIRMKRTMRRFSELVKL